MKHIDPSESKKRNIVDKLRCLPRKMLSLQGRDNIIDFVLYELSHDDCFDLEKAAYVVDNPDFDCLKGVAGFCKQEAYPDYSAVWQQPDVFSEHMKKNSFNQKIRNFHKESCLKKGKSDEQIVQEIAYDLGFEHPSFYAWTLKHDNHGILLYEKHDDTQCDCDYLLDGLCMIGFCPIY